MTQIVIGDLMMNECRKNSKYINLVEYILIIALYYVTGGAFSYTAYNVQITVFFIFSFATCVLLGKINQIFQKQIFIFLSLEGLFLLLVPFLNNDSYTSYIAIIMQLFIGAFCAIIIPLENFKYKYIRIMVFFAFVSLICFSLGFVYPQIITKFPKIVGDASVDYYNAFIYVFMSAKGYATTVLTTRNAGICWEPGCYQAFLNIALFFLLITEEKKHQKRFTLYFLVLVITILTTLSSLGIILLLLNLIRFRKILLKKMLKNSSYLLITLFCILILIVVLFQTGFIDTMIEKINYEFIVSNKEKGGLFDRISLDRIGYIMEDGFWFLGMSFQRWLTFNKSLWNSVIHSFLCLGTPFTLMHLFMYWRGSRRLALGSIILFVIMLMSASTETLFWRVFFNTIAFYGVIELHSYSYNEVGNKL